MSLHLNCVALVDDVIARHNGDPTQLVGILLDLEAGVERHYIPEPAAYYLAERLSIPPHAGLRRHVSFYTALHDQPRASTPFRCATVPPAGSRTATHV